MVFPRKRPKVEFKQTERQWVSLDSVQEKVESMPFQVTKFLNEAYLGRLGERDINRVVEDTEPEAFEKLSSFSVHGKHSQEEQSLVKQENSKKRKRTNDFNCERCHNEINEVYYRWLTHATKAIGKEIKKKSAVEKDKIAETSKSSKSKDKGKQRVIDIDSNEGQGDSDSTIIEEDEGSADCQICCTEKVPAKELTKCVDGHRFCMSCARKMAETEIGFQRTKLKCMHMQGCEAKFAESEVKRFLDDKTFKLWSRMQTSEEIKSAKIAGLESCPFCWYSYVVYPEDKDKPFFCGNAECGKWSCHHCKRLAHEGKTCEEARQANMTSAHRAEEKLAEALMRRCPKAGCNTVVVKDEVQRSCNKISCTKCNTTMCYVCRKDISKEGYAHFDQHARPQPEVKKEGRSSPKCPLFDDTTERHKKDVNIARKEVGKLAPSITQAEIEDERRRQQRFDRMYGRNAARVPGAWGFPDDAHNQGQPLNHFGGDENRIAFGLVQHQFRRLGEGRAQALDRNLQEEADRREAERGDPEVVRLERERQLVERQVEMRRLAPAYNVHYANGNVDAVGVGPLQGHLIAPIFPRNAVQERNVRVQQDPNNAARMNLDQLARQMHDMRNNIYEMEGALGYLNARNRIAELNARMQGLPRNLVNDAQNVIQANVQVERPDRNNDRNGFRPGWRAPSTTSKGNKADNSIKKEKKKSKPDLKLRKVNHVWQWLERSTTPRENAGTQSRDNKEEGSSKGKPIILDQEAAQAGPSKSAKKLTGNVIIDLTMSSDEEIDPFHDDDDDDDDLIYL